MKIVNMRKGDWNKTRAFFDIETDDGMVVKGFKLVEGQNGLFMSNPSEYSKKDDKYYDRVYIPRELKDQLEQDVITLYNNDSNDNEDNGTPF
jgi:stage V sporulation protein G